MPVPKPTLRRGEHSALMGQSGASPTKTDDPKLWVGRVPRVLLSDGGVRAGQAELEKSIVLRKLLPQE